MVILQARAVKPNGLHTNYNFYLAKEYKYAGQDACLVTTNKGRAQRYENEAEAEIVNDHLLASGWIKTPFEVVEIKQPKQ